MILSAAEFVALRTSADRAEQERAADEPASVEVWLEVDDDHPEMRFWVAQNKTVPIEVLTVLADDPDPRVRRMVARKRKLPAELLIRLADDRDDTVRLAVARHRRTPAEVRDRLAAGDPWEEVRAVAARHRSRERTTVHDPPEGGDRDELDR